MYLHLGQEVIVDTNNIIGIYDMDTSTISKWSREFLNKAEKEGRVVNVSFLICRNLLLFTKKTKKKK